MLIRLPFLRGLLTRVFFLPYTCHVVVFCLFLLFLLLFVFLFLVYLFLFCVSSVSLPGNDVLCWLLSCTFSYCLLSLFFPKYVLGFVWFGPVYLVTTAGFVAEQSMRDTK